MVMMDGSDGKQRKSTRRRILNGSGNNSGSSKIPNGNKKESNKKNSILVERKLGDRNNSKLPNLSYSSKNSLGQVRRKSKRKRKISCAVLSDSSMTVLSINTDTNAQSKQKGSESDVQKEQSHYKRAKKTGHNNCNACKEPVKRKSKNSCIVSSVLSKSVSFANNNNNNNNNNDKHSKRKRKSNGKEEQPQCKRTKISYHNGCNACGEHVKSKSRKTYAVLSESSKAVSAVTGNNLGKRLKQKKKSIIQEEIPQCKCFKITNHNNCNTCQGHQSTKPPVVRMKSSKVYPVVFEFPCKKSIFDKACNLRKIIESGELLPDSLRPLLNENVAKKYNANELATTIKESRCKWQEVENRALKLVKLIRSQLSIDKACPEKCLPHLDELKSLNVDALMLKRNPVLVRTVQVLCRYVGNAANDITEEEKNKFIESTAQVRNKSETLFQKFRELFNVKEGQPFMRLYKEKVREYQETKNSKFLKELCQKVTKGFCRTNKPKQSKKKVSKSIKN